MAKLIFKYGAMKSGKSMALMQIAYNYDEIGKKVVVIKPKVDTKGDDTIVSRIGPSRKVDIVLDEKESLLDSKYMQMYQESFCIFVDEAQFLSANTVEELWKISKVLDVPVICYGLKQDFTTHFFEGSRRLMELADEVTELETICACGNDAKFNVRKVDGKYQTSGAQTLIDGAKSEVTYEPMCGECYIKKVLRIKNIHDK